MSEERDIAAERIAKKYGISAGILKGWADSLDDMERLAQVVAAERSRAVDDAVKEATEFANRAEAVKQPEDNVPASVEEERKTLAWQKSEQARLLKERYPTMNIKVEGENDETLPDWELEENKPLAKRYPTMNIKTENVKVEQGSNTQ